MKTQAKKFPAILLAAWMLVTVLPFSAITAFAADAPTTVTSIEIEAIKPADGVEAKTDAIRIKSVNGDEALADTVACVLDDSAWWKVFPDDAEMLEGDILDTIAQIVEGKVAIIQAVDLKRKTMLSDGCFDLSDPDPVFGAPGFRAAVQKASRKRSR